jgi:hypothetical protein
MKLDPYNHEQKYQNWQKKIQAGIPGISKVNSDLIVKYLRDMESGINVSAKTSKGGRSFNRLNTLKERMLFFARTFKELYDVDNIVHITEEQLIRVCFEISFRLA